MELSEEVYFLDGAREWTLSSQTTQHVDNRTLVETSLRQPLGALREVSYQLFKGDEILASAFERRDDKLCAARQLAELLRLPLEEVLSDFDTICDRGWQERGITPEEIRKFCVWRGAPMLFVNCQGQLLDSYQPRRAPWPSRPGRGTRSSTRMRAASAAAHHIHAPADPVLVPLLQPTDQRRQPRRVHIGLACRGAEAALQHGRVRIFQAGLEPVALVAERLELLDLPAEGGAHRHHVVELAGAERDGRAAQLAGAALRGQDLLPLLRHLALRCRKTSLVAPASLWPRYFSPNRSIHACSASASSGSSQMTQSASPARSRKLRHSHKLRMATLGQCPAASSAPRAARRSRVQKWPARSSPSHSRQLPNSGTADSRRSDLKRGRRRSASSHWKEWARQRALPLAGVLPAGFGAGGTGGPPGRPDLR